MMWYKVLFLGAVIGLIPILLVMFVRNRKHQRIPVFMRRYSTQPPILEQCPVCVHASLYAMRPPNPTPDFDQKIRTPRVLCLLRRDPWREETCPDFMLGASRTGVES